jgi:hypothetical protein
MIKFMSSIPEFYIENDDASSVYNTEGFHDRIIELIENNLKGESIETTLCHLIAEDGTIMVADLPRNSYEKSIMRSMQFYVENENYEMCNKIKNLIEQIK